MTFLDRLDMLMESKSLNKMQLSKLSNVPYTTIDGFYKKGYENARISTIRKIATALNVSVDYLIEDTPTDTKTAPSLSDEAIQIARDYSKLDPPGQRAVKVILRDQQTRMSEDKVIPFPNKRHLPKSIQTVSAGRGAYLGPEEMETIDVIENDLTLRASFCVPVSGDSMEPIYHDGDIILVEGCEDIAVGQIGVFTVDGDGYVKKRGDRELISLNPSYPPVPMVENETWCNGLVIGVLDPEWVVE